jgi:hypothetical protein
VRVGVSVGVEVGGSGEGVNVDEGITVGVGEGGFDGVQAQSPRRIGRANKVSFA